jgi:hypothetical protein
LYVSSIKLVSVVLLLACGVGIAGCFHAEDPVIDRQCPRLATSFFRLPPKVQLEDFGRRDLEEQYTILICGNQAIHPPALYLAQLLALRGEGAAVFLKGKLARTKDDLTVRDIVVVFTEMHRNHTYDVAADRDLMTLIDSRLTTMKDAGWKSLVSQRVAEIRSNE